MDTTQSSTSRAFAGVMQQRLTVHRSQKSAAFTLVELLIVIGIIALLISILLPSLNRARQSAIAVNCLSNLRQIAIGTIQYTTENRNWFPPTSVSGTTGLDDNWISMISPYVGDSKKVFLCPLNEFSLIERNVMFNGSEFDTAGKKQFPFMGLHGLKITQVRNPTEKAMVFDIHVILDTSLPLFKTDTVTWSEYHDSIIALDHPTIRKAPHSTKDSYRTHLAYADGHCGSIEYESSGRLPYIVFYGDRD